MEMLSQISLGQILRYLHFSQVLGRQNLRLEILIQQSLDLYICYIFPPDPGAVMYTLTGWPY